MFLYLTPFSSPFIVPVAVFAMVLGIVISQHVAEYSKRRLQSEERMAAIARGLPLPADPMPKPGSSEHDRRKRARNLRTGGIVLIAVGAGLALFSFVLEQILQEHNVLAIAAVALIPLAIGVGLLVDYWLQARELARDPAN